MLTLDIEMPRMDGLTFLKILQEHRPIPVIVISSISQSGSVAALTALEYGAVEVLAKPTSAYSIGQLGEQLPRHIKAAAASRPRRRPADAAPAIVSRPAAGFHQRQIIAITQHIPSYFSRAVAERIDGISAVEVREAAEGDMVAPGTALIAPGDFHMMLSWAGTGYKVSLNQRPPVHHCRPAVDVMFRSISQCFGARVVCAVLTGMGHDGAMGMKMLKEIGARTIAQDEEFSVVYGMPLAAVELGVVDRVLPLSKIPSALIEAAQAMSAAPLAECAA